MVKCLLNFLLIFLMLSTFSLAKDDDAKLKNEFGQDLTRAPFFLRFSFSKENNKDWKQSNYAERKAFLIKYEGYLATEQANEKADAKAQADKEKERKLEEKNLQSKLAERLKAQEDEDKAVQKEYEDRQASSNKAFYDQQKALQQMQQQTFQNNR